MFFLFLFFFSHQLLNMESLHGAVCHVLLQSVIQLNHDFALGHKKV